MGGCAGEAVAMSGNCQIRICITISAAAAIYRILFVIGGPVLGGHVLGFLYFRQSNIYKCRLSTVELV